MPCRECEGGKWKWGRTGECEYDTEDECERANQGATQMRLLDVVNAPWAITPPALMEIAEIYRTHLRGDKIDIPSVEARLGRSLDNEPNNYDVVDGVAIVEMTGAIAKRMNLFSQISGGASAQLAENAIKGALADEDVNSIILSIDSPGGTVDGTFELADMIYAARGQKPIVAFADGLMASAAYAIGAAADSIFISGDTATIGSIGVVATHVDVSEAEKKEGIKTTEITAGKFKRIASAYEPLSKDGRADIQAQVDELYSIFVERVATFRDVSVEIVLEDMADGRLFIGQQAIKAGLVDGVSTLDGLVAKLSQGESLAPNVLTATGGASDSVGAELTNDTSQEETTVDKSQVENEFPEVAEAFRAEGRAEGVTTGADAERERILAVQGQSMAGHEKLIQTLMFDGKTTGPEAAVAVLNAERGVRTATVEQIEKDAPEAVVAAAGEQELETDLPLCHWMNAASWSGRMMRVFAMNSTASKRIQLTPTQWIRVTPASLLNKEVVQHGY